MTDTEKSSLPLPGVMPDRLPESARAPADFEPRTVAKECRDRC
jgi:hypothetical protein